MAQVTEEAKKKQLTVYLPDTRGVTISRFGIGNLKIGLGVHTYSRLPGHNSRTALGIIPLQIERTVDDCENGRANGKELHGTCPGATDECQKICYASRPVTENGPVFEMWKRNSATEDVPMELPPGARLVRLHISGDFSSQGYINGWYALLVGRPDVKVWAYTRSWRVPELRPALERLRSLHHVQIFASVDSTTPTKEIESITTEVSKAGGVPWRLAWIDGDDRGDRTTWDDAEERRRKAGIRLTRFGAKTLICPEETKTKENCEACRYCFDGKKNDVTFLRH